VILQSGHLVCRALDRKCKGCRFESCARSIFYNAYFLQRFFWRLYVVAILVALMPDIRYAALRF